MYQHYFSHISICVGVVIFPCLLFILFLNVPPFLLLVCKLLSLSYVNLPASSLPARWADCQHVTGARIPSVSGCAPGHPRLPAGKLSSVVCLSLPK